MSILANGQKTHDVNNIAHISGLFSFINGIYARLQVLAGTMG